MSKTEKLITGNAAGFQEAIEEALYGKANDLLVELSSKLLRKYIGKAALDVAFKNDNAGRRSKLGKVYKRKGMKLAADHMKKDTAKVNKKIGQRASGIAKAAKKINWNSNVHKEEVELVEAPLGGEKYRGKENPNVRKDPDHYGNKAHKYIKKHAVALTKGDDHKVKRLTQAADAAETLEAKAEAKKSKEQYSALSLHKKKAA